VWHKLTVGLGTLPVASPSDNALWQARARLGTAPVAASSIASGIPSSRATSRATTGAVPHPARNSRQPGGPGPRTAPPPPTRQDPPDHPGDCDLSSGDRRTWREHGDPETLISAIQRREQRLRASWQEDGADTELLRSAFGRYRAFFDLLTKV
jgi:hypothetical protein